MATPFPIPVTAAQVGTYFVGQYYQVLHQQPDFAFQFYSDSSTMLRIDGSFRETATAMLQIHAVIMSLGYTGIEIKTVNALESWNGGVIVMVSGSVQLKNFTQRKFMETFFLAPQEKGYFVLNDIFHYADEEAILHHPTLLLPQSSLVSKINASTTIQDTVPNYMLGGEIQARDFAAPVVKENGAVPNYSLIEQQTHEVSGTENAVEDNVVEESNPSHQNTMNVPHDSLSASAVEPIGEPQKHTYASILLVAKGQSPPSSAPSISVNKNTQIVLEQNHILPSATQQFVTSPHELEMDETTEELPIIEEDEGEIKSVYVRNLPPTVSVSDVEEEFQHFGKLSSDGVVIRSRKDVGVCYAFVEFEEVSGVQNAIKAGTAQVAGRQVYIEERRPNSNIPSRGGRRGRGRGSYQLEASRSRFPSRSYMQGGISNGGDRDYTRPDRDYTRPRGNGFYRPTIRHDRVIRSYQPSRNGENPSDST